MKVTVRVEEGKIPEEAVLYSNTLTYSWTIRMEELPGRAVSGEKYEVLLDGKRLVMIEQATETAGQIRRRADKRLKKLRRQ